MGDFDQLTVDDLHEIVHADRLAAMRKQAEGWQGMAALFTTQLERLDKAVSSLRTAWDSPAGNAFLTEVGKIVQTLDLAQQKATSNHTAWTAIANQAETTKTAVTQIHSEYQAAWGKAQTDFQAAKQKDAHNTNWAWGGLGDLWDDPTPPDQNAVRQPYDVRARAAMQTADGVYTNQYYQNLWWPPDYQGPTDALVTANQGGPGATTHAGAGGGATAPAGQGAPRGSVPSGSVAPNPNDGGLVWQPPLGSPPPVPAALPTPSAPPVGGLPPGTLPPPMVPLPPGRPAPPPGSTVPPGGTRPPLVPEIPQTRPVVGRTPPTGRLPATAPGNEPVIGSRRPPAGESLPGRGPGSGSRVSEPVVGGRGAGGRGVAGRAFGEPAQPGRAGRPGGATADRHGVVRPSRTSGGTDANRASARGSRRRRDADEALTATELLDDTGLFTVDGAVTEVVAPAEPTDPANQRPGPHVGGVKRKR